MERAYKRPSWGAAQVFRPGDRDLFDLENVGSYTTIGFDYAPRRGV